MRIRLLLLGKTRRPEIRALLDDYAERIRRYAEFEVREIREDSAEIKKVQIPAGVAVLLDASGTSYDSNKFAAWLGRCREREIAFLCGGASGFPEALARRA